MANASHTRGPWSATTWLGTVAGNGEFVGEHNAVFETASLVLTPTRAKMIAPCGLSDDPESLPNARLIAAAPDLLEALKGLLASHNDKRSKRSWPVSVAAAHDAIAKAEGR